MGPAGHVVDIGGSRSPYSNQIIHDRWTSIDLARDPGVDALGDAHQLPFEASEFDTAMAIEVLEHCIEPSLVLSEAHRVLKIGGTLVLSTRFIYFYHPYPADYFRFTKDSLLALAAPFTEIQIYPQGNVVQSIWQLLTARYEYPKLIAPAVYVLNQLVARISFEDHKSPSGFILVARK